MEPFISQPSTMIVSPTPSRTSRADSRSKWESKRPEAPARSSAATWWSGWPSSLAASMGTFSTSSRSGSAFRHRAQGSRMYAGPSMPDQSSPGR
ncbi:hypothetical protein ACSNOI_32165 [Actinomadura kijaniata]|uniref:hypothetical protein n=1 Tax=Actinomadura kijaniata TaxID=46161 RepID=UPI003F1E2EDB